MIQNEIPGLGLQSIIFGSPPWGGDLRQAPSWISADSLGPGYQSNSIFDLTNMQPYSISDLLAIFRPWTEEIVLYLPRTSNMRQLAASGKDLNSMTVMHYCMEGASKVRKLL